MPAKSSPELLANLFAKFQRQVKASTGVTLSMRRVSEELLARPAPGRGTASGESTVGDGTARTRKPDVSALSRWTKPSGRSNWHIPIGRVMEVTHQLNASTSERDALMLARLSEIAQTDPEHDVLVCGAWIAGRVSDQLQLDADEQAVLEAFRKNRAVSPYSMLTPSRLARLGAVFGEMAHEHLSELAPDDDASPDDYSPADEARLRARRDATMAALRVAQTPVRKQSEVSAAALAKRLLRTLRKPSLA